MSWKKLILLTAFSLVGLWASSMVLVVWNELRDPLPFCTIPKETSGIVIDCGKVLSSKYSEIFGIPLEVVAIFYFMVNIGLVYIIGFGNDRVFRLSFKSLYVWRFLGLTIVPYLLTVELFIIKAICLYCTVMHIAIIVDFGIISYFLFYRKDARSLVFQLQKDRDFEPGLSGLR